MQRSARLPALLAFGLLAGCGRGTPREVVVVQPAVPSSLWPEARLDEYSISVLSNVYEPLVETSRSLGVEPGLAESWENPDQLTWVFRLRSGVRLHDGREFDSALAVAAMRRIARDAGAGFTADFGTLTSFDAPDARTLVIRTGVPVIPARGVGGVPLAFEPAGQSGPPVGTGPFRIASWEPGRSVRLQAFEDLGAVGLSVTPRAVASDRFLIGSDPDTQLWLLGWMSTRDAALSYDHLVHTPTERLGRFNWMGYSSPEVDEALDGFRRRTDPEHGGPALARVARRLAEDLPIIGLYQTIDLHAKAADLVYDPRMDRRVLGVAMAWR